jgi:ribosomal protein RSM22 (predicted rRNA methylase)
MPATYAVARAVLHHLRDAVRDFQPRSLLDLGAGTGAAAWAVAELWPDVGELRLREQSDVAIALGKRLMHASGSPALQNADWRQWRLSSTRDADEPADLAIAAYVLGELTADQEVTLLTTLTASNTVVVIEPGTPAGFARIIGARSYLLDAGFTIAAPCPHELTCPMLTRDDWCHFAERLDRSSLHRALKAGELSYEDEKFSYVAATRGTTRRPPDRILRHPTQRKGLVSLQLCDVSGAALDLRVSKSQELYKAARHAAWGDAWPPETSTTRPPT